MSKLGAPFKFSRCRFCLLLLCWLSASVPVIHAADENANPASDRVSYYRQVRPILQARCQGCHQPAKAGGKYVMTTFDRLLSGGESEEAAIAAGNVAESYLIELITPAGGKAEMPKGKPPLADAEIELIRSWIAAGAVDDTPAGARQSFDNENPPTYWRPPVITSLDYSPDGQLLAIAGFHEVLLMKSDGAQQVARLIGMSERIESVRFSPDGSRLAVTGGLPGRLGELQVWDVAKRKLVASIPSTFDTLYGGSWSPDGKQIAYGASDNGVRAVDVESGQVVVYMAAHADWPRGTTYSADGKSIFSVSRDKTVKMTDVATQRFVGNLTTHTPGVLRGGMIAIARHPKRNEVLVGGADGAPKLFRMDVKAAPAGGGNPNQIRAYAALPGRLFAVAFQPDGARAFAASSLDGAGQISAFETDSGKQIWKLPVPGSGVFALACAPDGKTVAAAGADGSVRLVDAANGSLIASFLPVELVTEPSAVVGRGDSRKSATAPAATPRPLPADAKVIALIAQPAVIAIARSTEYTQLVLTARLAGDVQTDVTRLAKWMVADNVGAVSADGLFTPLKNGQGKVIAELAGQRVEIPVDVSGFDGAVEPDFIRDVNPVLSRVGCNAGTCHGADKGRNGFKLSLRGYDAILDVRGFTDDMASRRVNLAAPDSSLMLLKPTAAVPHEGGQLFTPDQPYYAVIRDWIAGGAKLDLDTPRVTGIEVFPQNPVVQEIGATQQVRVVATYADGQQRDVTREAFISSANTEVATADQRGKMTAVRRGEAAVLARYEGAYTATTLTVMGDRDGFAWKQPEAWGRIDELVAAKWQRLKIQPSALCNDAEYIRRVQLDLTGLPPTADEVTAFLADERDSRTKRDDLVDRLIGSDDFVEYWTNKWADLLQVNRKFLGPQGSAAFHKWIRDEVAANTPYDEFARKILTATGSNRENPAASYFKVLRDPAATMENTTHLFLGVRFSCNKCHDHPFERWTQDQYYQTAAFFAQVELKADPKSGKGKVGGTAVEGAKPLYEIIADKKNGEIVHERTKQVTPPQFPFPCKFEASEQATRREQLAAWMTSSDNDYFATSYVNRLWGYLFGVGIIEPIDDIRASNPPTNPELLNHLARAFIDSGFDVRHVMREICTSRTYQLSLQTNAWNEDDAINYSHAIARRLPAEVLYDAVHRVTGSVARIPGVPAGTRAAALPDAGIRLSDGFLTTLGRPARESACECERTSGLQLGPVMALISGPTVDNAITDRNNAITKLAASEQDDGQLINALFLRVFNRPATEAEISAGLSALGDLPQEHERLVAQLTQLQQDWDNETSDQQRKRKEAIDKTTKGLVAYEKQVAAREDELDKQHRDRRTQAAAAVQAYEKELPTRLAAWEEKVGGKESWSVLDPAELSATNNAKLAKEQDLSVWVTGPNGKGTYQFVALTDVGAITGVRLEALRDDRLPAKGPGRAPNGNFVLTEFRVEWAPANAPEKRRPVELQNAQADFSQQNYDVATAIDKQDAATNNGWATSPKFGQNRTAVFETKSSTPAEPGRLSFLLVQNYQDGQHSIGRFRISITNAPRPIRLDGLPKNITDVLAVAVDQRSDKQKQDLASFYRGIDEELKQRQQALAEAKKPRPVDPELEKLRRQLADASKPLPLDPQLMELRRSVELSAKQLTESRLTFAQDLTWALINNPAFLFNR